MLVSAVAVPEHAACAGLRVPSQSRVRQSTQGEEYDEDGFLVEKDDDAASQVCLSPVGVSPAIAASGCKACAVLVKTHGLAAVCTPRSSREGNLCRLLSSPSSLQASQSRPTRPPAPASGGVRSTRESIAEGDTESDSDEDILAQAGSPCSSSSGAEALSACGLAVLCCHMPCSRLAVADQASL